MSPGPEGEHTTVASATGPSRARLIVVIALLTMLGPFTIDTIFPAFTQISRDLSADAVAMQQTISVYLITYAFASLFHGSLSDALGRRPVIIVGLTLYALTSAWCALAPTISSLLVARAGQGLVAGAGMIIGRTIVRDVVEGHAAQRLMSNVSLVFATAPAVAPIAGGWILGWSSWRAIFWLLAGYGLLLVLLAVFALPETHPAANRVPFHPRPLLASFAGAARDPSVARLSAAIALNFAGLFLYISSAPAIIVTHLGLGPQDFGVLFIPLVAAMMLGSFLTGRLLGRIRPGVFVATGFLTAIAGAAFAVLYQSLASVATLPWTVVPAAAAGFGVSLIFPILTIQLLDLRPRERGAVSSVQAFLNMVLNAVVAGVVSPLVSHSLSLLGLVAGTFSAVAMLLWLWHRAVHRETTWA